MFWLMLKESNIYAPEFKFAQELLHQLEDFITVMMTTQKWPLEEISFSACHVQSQCKLDQPFPENPSL